MKGTTLPKLKRQEEIIIPKIGRRAYAPMDFSKGERIRIIMSSYWRLNDIRVSEGIVINPYSYKKAFYENKNESAIEMIVERKSIKKNGNKIILEEVHCKRHGKFSYSSIRYAERIS